MPETLVRSGRCAIIGQPNVGKSTLLNALVGQKLAIATSRPRTTRTSILGVYISERPPTRIAFVDTPGLHRPDSALERSAVEAAKGSLSEADVALLLVSVGRDGRTREGSSEDEVLEIARQSDRPLILALNKIDQVRDKSLLLPTLQAWGARHPFAAIVPISALTDVNLEPLVAEIRNLLPEGPGEFDDALSDRPERFFVAELVREAVITHTRQEVPYGVAVTIETFAEEAKQTRIEASIVVERESHKGIVIGKGGMMLKAIGIDARQEIEAFLGRHVFLKLWVKVVERWTRNPARVRELIDGAPPIEE